MRYLFCCRFRRCHRHIIARAATHFVRAHISTLNPPNRHHLAGCDFWHACQNGKLWHIIFSRATNYKRFFPVFFRPCIRSFCRYNGRASLQRISSPCFTATGMLSDIVMRAAPKIACVSYDFMHERNSLNQQTYYYTFMIDITASHRCREYHQSRLLSLAPSPRAFPVIRSSVISAESGLNRFATKTVTNFHRVRSYCHSRKKST